MTSERLDLDLEGVDLISKLRHRPTVVVRLDAQLLEDALQFAVLGGQVASSPLFRIQFRFNVAELEVCTGTGTDKKYCLN